jgi:tripartite-type tricarboxylate transporter receptor subunit TctC
VPAPNAAGDKSGTLSDYAGQSQRAAVAWLRPGYEIRKFRDAARGSDHNEYVAFNEEGHAAAHDIADGERPLYRGGPAYSGIAGAVQSGLVKAIAVASEKPLAEFPDLPTVDETIPGFFGKPAGKSWWRRSAPPETIIRKISEDLRKVVTDPGLMQKISARGSYTRAMSPAEAVALVHSEQRKWKPAIEHIANRTQ